MDGCPGQASVVVSIVKCMKNCQHGRSSGCPSLHLFPCRAPLSLSFFLSFSACLGKLQVAEEASCQVRACVRPCVRVRCITHATRCEAAIYGQWLQMNKAANSFDKLHCRLLIIELRACLEGGQRSGGRGWLEIKRLVGETQRF